MKKRKREYVHEGEVPDTLDLFLEWVNELAEAIPVPLCEVDVDLEEYCGEPTIEIGYWRDETDEEEKVREDRAKEYEAEELKRLKARIKGLECNQ